MNTSGTRDYCPMHWCIRIPSCYEVAMAHYKSEQKIRQLETIHQNALREIRLWKRNAKLNRLRKRLRSI